jgi:hypothetical protein
MGWKRCGGKRAVTLKCKPKFVSEGNTSHKTCQKYSKQRWFGYEAGVSSPRLQLKAVCHLLARYRNGNEWSSTTGGGRGGGGQRNNKLRVRTSPECIQLPIKSNEGSFALGLSEFNYFSMFLLTYGEMLQHKTCPILNI